MRNTISFFVIFSISTFTSSNLVAQTSFQEGVITYKVDTLYRRVPHPMENRVREIHLYKKGNLHRLEIIKNFTNDTTNADTEIQIINKNGKYYFSGDATSSVYLALFTSYEEGRNRKAEIAFKGFIKTFSIERVADQTTMLDISVDKMILKDNHDGETVEVLVAKDLKTEFGFFFDCYSNIKGTALQFDDEEGGWQLRYTATTIENKELSDNLFQIDNKYTVISVEDMLNQIKGKN